MKKRQEVECWKFAAAAGWTLFLMAALFSLLLLCIFVR